MKIRIENGLPVVCIQVKYKEKEVTLQNVLLDTGSSNTIFDSDAIYPVDLVIDSVNGKARRMYGIGGESELCYEQKIQELKINSYTLNNFAIQLGITRETYGFDGILGLDFMLYNKISLDFGDLQAK